MQQFQIYKNLARINDLPEADAVPMFLDCCGSREWASRMTAARPFSMVESLFEKAGCIWLGLRKSDWLEAFSVHPKIGSGRSAANQQAKSAAWSKSEQAGMKMAGDAVREALRDANRLYEEKFGFIFIVCANGRSAEEMLEICVERLGSDPDAEICLAAEEQRKITQIRLSRLLEQ